MASTTTVCLEYKQKMLRADAILADWSSPNWKMMILSGALFDPLTIATINEVSANEVATGTAYAGPITLPNITLTPSGNNVVVDWDDIRVDQDAGGFNNGTHAAIFYDSGTPTTSPVWGLWDFDKTVDNTAEPIDFKTPNNVFQI